MRFGKFAFRLAVLTVVSSLCIISCTASELSGLLSLCINEMFYGTLPLKIYIDTAGGAQITSKEDYIGCTVSAVGNEHPVASESAKIKGRGNSSWEMPKKSYKLKFSDETALIGNESAKTWTLISNYADQSLMRNKLAYEISATLDSQPFTTHSELAELYLNGEYAGIYLVCEQIEAGDGRVEISRLSQDPKDTGYLIEIDTHAKDEGVNGIDWFMLEDEVYAVKEPDTGNRSFSQNHFDYIKDHITQCFDALCGESFADVAEKLDIPSFADAYIIHELFNCCDVGFSSYYMYKDAGGKLCCGPVWDFDISAGNCNYNESSDPKLLWAAKENIWYAKLLGFTEFKEEVSKKLQKYSTLIPTVIKDETYSVLPYFSAFDKNFDRWHVMGRAIWPNTDELAALKNWSQHIAYLQDWLGQSLDFMIKTYC